VKITINQFRSLGRMMFKGISNILVLRSPVARHVHPGLNQSIHHIACQGEWIVDKHDHTPKSPSVGELLVL
jgi:hypothetical protein